MPCIKEIIIMMMMIIIIIIIIITAGRGNRGMENIA